jgi:hypothetical protein
MSDESDEYVVMCGFWTVLERPGISGHELKSLRQKSRPSGSEKDKKKKSMKRRKEDDSWCRRRDARSLMMV